MRDREQGDMDMVLGPTVGGYWASAGAYVVVHVGPTEGNI